VHVSKNKELMNSSSCHLFNDIGCFVSYCNDILCLDCLWIYSPVVDADVVDQAGEEGAGGESVADAKVYSCDFYEFASCVIWVYSISFYLFETPH
jgi:hypothetical protein